MVKKDSFLSFLIVLVPLLLLVLCSYKKDGNYLEMFTSLIGEEIKDDFKEKLSNLKYFHSKNVMPSNKVATNPVHSNKQYLERIKRNKLPRQEIKSQQFGIPFQIETFSNGDENWKNLKFYHDQNVRPYLVATNPVHVKDFQPNSEDIIEGFSIKNMFSKPNNKIKLEDPLIPHGDAITKQLKNIKAEPTIKNPRTLSNGLPTGTIQSNIEAQFLNNLNKANDNNSAVNRMLEEEAINNSQKAVPMINAKPQSIVKNTLPKQDFQQKFECQFYNDVCPAGYFENGSFTISGLGEGMGISCGNKSLNNNNMKECKCVAEIRDKRLRRIHITDPGSGYKLDNPPIVKILSRNRRGSGASAECIVDDEGRVQYINVLSEGNGYTETPIIQIVNSNTNQSCRLCCKQ
jgi:hypothetical protein